MVILSNLVICRLPMSTLGLFGTMNTQRSLSLGQRIKDRLGLKGRMRYPKWAMKRAAIRLYLCNSELVDQNTFITKFQLPDVYQSWFRVVELHIWLTYVRLSQEGREGSYVKRHFGKNLWEDVEKRSKTLGAVGSSVARKEGLGMLALEMRSALLSYDEGLLGTDMDLAASLWRSFFLFECEDPQHLAELVDYIRKQIVHLEKQDSKLILYNGLITFLPLLPDDNKIDIQKGLSEIVRRA